jgi:hypothetical protein
MLSRFITLGLLSATLCLNFTHADSKNSDSEKFEKTTIEGKEFITLTPAGNTFSNTVAKQQITGKIKKITKTEALAWVVKFVKLSDKEAQKSPDWNSINNFYNHLILCDELLNKMLINNAEEAPPGDDKIPDGLKKMLIGKLEELREKLKTDIETLVDPNSRANFKVLVDFYDKALKETLDLN